MNGKFNNLKWMFTKKTKSLWTEVTGLCKCSNPYQIVSVIGWNDDW